MKKIAAIVLLIICLTPGASAQEIVETHSTFTNANTSAYFSTEANQSNQQEIELKATLNLMFHSDWKINITTIIITTIEISCLFMLEEPDWTRTNKSVLYKLENMRYYSMSGMIRENQSHTSRINSALKSEYNYLIVDNTNNVSLKIAFLIEYRLYWEWEITKKDDSLLPQSKEAYIFATIMVTGILIGSVFGFWFRPQYDEMIDRDRERRERAEELHKASNIVEASNKGDQ